MEQYLFSIAAWGFALWAFLLVGNHSHNLLTWNDCCKRELTHQLVYWLVLEDLSIVCLALDLLELDDNLRLFSLYFRDNNYTREHNY